jgi:hypothetical protein
MQNVDSLERQLISMSGSLDYPPTPDLASGFWRRLESSTARRAMPFSPRALALGLAALVLAVAATFAIIAPARDAAADLFHSINIFETNESTEGLPTDIAGKASTLEEAQTALGRHIVQPTEPSALKLDHVLLQQYGSVYVAVLFYQGDGLSFELFASNSGIGKGLPFGGDATAEPVSGLGSEAYWLTGKRIVQSVTATGAVITDSKRVTDANTLIWDASGFVYRIEGNIDKDQAIAIAQTVR